MRIFYPCLCKLVGFFRNNGVLQCKCISGFYRLVSNALCCAHSKNIEKRSKGNQEYRLIAVWIMKKTLAVILLICMFCMAVAGCDNGGKPSESKNPGSAIESLTATEASTTLKIGESILITNFYEIKGTSALSAAQRACTYESSNSEIVKINAKRAEAVAPGTATITVTSKVDTTKSCSFEVVVAKVFIDRDLSMIPSEDDFTNEWDETTGTGSFRTNSGLTNFYYIADINSTQWYVETDITVHKVNFDDRWPKVGIVAAGKNSSGVETMVAFFLNASIGLNDTYDENGNLLKGEDNNAWNEFGVCEVAQGGHWAWEAGITNSLARHHDYAWNTGDNKITFETTFKLGVARDGANFHVYVNGQYMGSFQLSASLDILYENGAPMASHVAFYHFNSEVTFSNYLATADAAEVAKKIPEAPVYCEFLED